MSAPHPLIIVGLDGATLRVLEPLAKTGRIPTLARLMREGLTGTLRSTVPVATLPAWTSFMTASHPATHGVTDIFMRTPGSYGLQPSSGAHRQLPTILNHLSSRGYRVASLGIPGTYPPERLNGICVSGFDAPGATRTPRDGIWPPEAETLINEPGGWRFGVFNEHASASRRYEHATQSLLQDIAIKEKIVLNTYRTQPWDLFFFHIQATDTASHHLWHTWDRASPRGIAVDATDDLASIFERVDVMLSRLVDLIASHGRILVVSDHGFGGASDRAVFLNRWLHEEGLLEFESTFVRTKATLKRQGADAIAARVPTRLIRTLSHRAPQFITKRLLGIARDQGIDHRRTQAFSHELDYAPSIWLNRRSLFPHGSLDESSATQLTEHIRTRLLDLRDPATGNALVERVHLRHELPPGTSADYLPDLLLEPAWPHGYRPSFLMSRGPGPWIETLSTKEMNAPRGHGMPGVHHRDGIFIAHGTGLPAMSLPLLDIPQAGALIYPLMGLPMPRTLNTAPPSYLDEIFNLRWDDAEDAPNHREGASPNHPVDAPQATVIRRLEQLGYLD